MLVSVIIPTYNGQHTLARAINSVLDQRGDFDVEILVCDDCSEDRTVSIARTFGCRVLINPAHTGGPNAGRNRGIKAARGDFIAFLDQDDEWLPGKLQLQIDKMNEGYDVVSTGKLVRHES